jgi:hypothetical protein
VLLGKLEAGERFLSVGLFQGTPRLSSQYTLAKAEAAAAAAGSTYSATLNAKMMSASASGADGEGDEERLPDPTLFAAAWRRHRFYMFSRREPTDLGAGGGAEAG